MKIYQNLGIVAFDDMYFFRDMRHKFYVTRKGYFSLILYKNNSQNLKKKISLKLYISQVSSPDVHNQHLLGRVKEGLQLATKKIIKANC